MCIKKKQSQKPEKDCSPKERKILSCRGYEWIPAKYYNRAWKEVGKLLNTHFCSKIWISAATKVSQLIQQTSKASPEEKRKLFCACQPRTLFQGKNEFAIKALDGDPGDFSLVLVSLTDP